METGFLPELMKIRDTFMFGSFHVIKFLRLERIFCFDIKKKLFRIEGLVIMERVFYPKPPIQKLIK